MKRKKYGITMVLALLAMLVPLWLPIRVRVIYNPSPSAALGWYLVRPAVAVAAGDLVIARLPTAWARWAEARGYLPARVPLLKRVAAVAGAFVCVREDVLYVDGVPRVRLLLRDRLGRALPRRVPCRPLAPNELLLLNPEHPASFDGRYFGPLSTSTLRGRAVPLWTWVAPES